nr:stress regulated protein isoform 3 [Ipomoea batatas]
MSATCYGGFRHHPRLGLCNSRIVCLSESGGGERWQVLKRVDEELSKGDERAALSLVKDLQGKPGGLRCFGAARQIPQRLYSLEELRLNGIETVSLLSPVDATLGSIERNLQIAALSGGVAAWNVLNLNPQQILYISLGLLFLLTFDSVAFNGGFGALILDTIGHTLSEKYHNRVTQHEAGHFLIAYLLGILPRGYTLTSLEALKKEGSLNVQAGTAFVDFEFLEELPILLIVLGCILTVSILLVCIARSLGLSSTFSEVNKGQVSATMLNRFSCIALAGVATEYLLFGCAEGGLTDINQYAKSPVTNHCHTCPHLPPTIGRVITNFAHISFSRTPCNVRCSSRSGHGQPPIELGVTPAQVVRVIHLKPRGLRFEPQTPGFEPVSYGQPRLIYLLVALCQLGSQGKENNLVKTRKRRGGRGDLKVMTGGGSVGYKSYCKHGYQTGFTYTRNGCGVSLVIQKERTLNAPGAYGIVEKFEPTDGNAPVRTLNAPGAYGIVEKFEPTDGNAPVRSWVRFLVTASHILPVLFLVTTSHIPRFTSSTRLQGKGAHDGALLPSGPLPARVIRRGLQGGVYPMHTLGAIRRGLPSAPLKLRITQCTPSAHPVHMAVGLSTAKPGVYTEKGRFSGEMGCTEHYTHSAPPRECPSKACRGNV